MNTALILKNDFEALYRLAVRTYSEAIDDAKDHVIKTSSYDEATYLAGQVRGLYTALKLLLEGDDLVEAGDRIRSLDRISHRLEEARAKI